LRRHALADGILDASLLRRYESLRPANERSPTWDDKQRGVVTRALDVLEKEVKDLGKPNAKNTTLGHIAIGCALGYLDFRFAAENWRTGRAKLAAWYEAFAKRPSMAATAPKDQT
jgi:glutathione S-transferase